jgi:PmbA protein
MSELIEIADELVRQARVEGANDVVAEVFDSKTHQVRYSNSSIDASNWWGEKHAHLFMAVGKRTVSTDIRDLASAKGLIPELITTAKASPVNKDYAGIASGRFKYKRSRPDPKILSMRSPAKYVHDAIGAAEREGAIEVGGTFFVRHNRVAICSTGGARGEDENASVELSVRAFTQPEASGHAVSCSHRLSDLNAVATGRKAGGLAKAARDPQQGDIGKQDLVIEPLLLGELIYSTSSMMSAHYVQLGLSMYEKKIGKKVASDLVTFYDDPTVPSISQRAFDHEGMPTKKVVVIKNGVLKTYLHNTSTAKRFRTKSTASAGPFVPTGFDPPAVPLASHPVVEPGDWSLEEMIADTKHGLYLNHTWYTRYQSYARGDFSTIPRDAILRIENGQIVGSVKNIRISDNMLNLWKSIDALSKAREEVYWWDEVAPPSTIPAVRCRGLNITRSS